MLMQGAHPPPLPPFLFVHFCYCKDAVRAQSLAGTSCNSVRSQGFTSFLVRVSCNTLTPVVSDSYYLIIQLLRPSVRVTSREIRLGTSLLLIQREQLLLTISCAPAFYTKPPGPLTLFPSVMLHYPDQDAPLTMQELSAAIVAVLLCLDVGLMAS